MRLDFHRLCLYSATVVLWECDVACVGVSHHTTTLGPVRRSSNVMQERIDSAMVGTLLEGVAMDPMEIFPQLPTSGHHH